MKVRVLAILAALVVASTVLLASAPNANAASYARISSHVAGFNIWEVQSYCADYSGKRAKASLHIWRVNPYGSDPLLASDSSSTERTLFASAKGGGRSDLYATVTCTYSMSNGSKKTFTATTSHDFG